ncbi:MAG TPA: hypothetical protein EYQ31_01585, partial [Candidatus Handelsmanbacteria bacterium]|nr:hypothetical protein [Candidatus Handelsmanbacteria bacterium]
MWQIDREHCRITGATHNKPWALIGAIFFLSQLVGLPATFSAPALVRRFGATLVILPARTVGGVALGIMGTVINLPVAMVMFLLTRAAEEEA